MKKLFLFLLMASLFVTKVNGQFFSLSDTTITFKNQEGKVLTKDEVRELMKGTFSIHQENIDGRKVITIIPSGNDEKAIQQAKLDAFKNGLINKPLKSFHLTDLITKNGIQKN